MMLVHFRSENQQGRHQGDKCWHGHGGELPIRDSLFTSPLFSGFQAMAQLYNATNPDIHKGTLNGWDLPPQLNVDANGNRGDTYSSFLKPIEGQRPNLAIVRHAQVSKVLFDRKKRARGISYKFPR